MPAYIIGMRPAVVICAVSKDLVNSDLDMLVDWTMSPEDTYGIAFPTRL